MGHGGHPHVVGLYSPVPILYAANTNIDMATSVLQLCHVSFTTSESRVLLFTLSVQEDLQAADDEEASSSNSDSDSESSTSDSSAKCAMQSESEKEDTCNWD